MVAKMGESSMTIAESIRAEIKRQGFYRVTVARALNIHPDTLRLWLLGKRRMPDEQARRVVEYLGGRWEPARVEWKR
jgi:hypothetical protein